MRKIIVTTTINPPTEALIKFSKMKDWKLVVIGDQKTPEKEYKKLKDIIFLSPKDQERMSKRISDLIGWNCIQRRNFGFMYASKLKADIIASVDDDNIPLKNWGKNLLVGKYVYLPIYKDKSGFFDPISVTEHKKLWHRGFPIQILNKRKPFVIRKKKIRCLVQADFWNGDPDIDAICRIAIKPIVNFKNFKPFTTNVLTPFNSQNTFIHSSILKNYLMIPKIGRMDDIWGAYYLQQKLKNKIPFVVFSKASVYQNRNVHDLSVDLNNEVLGYEHNHKFNKKSVLKFLPKQTKELIILYRNFIR